MIRRSDKANMISGVHKRSENIRGFEARFLIVCEGGRTEPDYFRQFPVRTAWVEPIGTGMNSLSLVEKALELREKMGYIEPTDQTWCVFDRDDCPRSQFNDALSLIEQNSNLNIHAAYSNQAFELWFLLHFGLYQSAHHRSEYCKKLSELLKRTYQKSDIRIYDDIFDLQGTAIRNAKQLLKNANSRNMRPVDANPSTTVFMLVEELRKHFR